MGTWRKGRDRPRSEMVKALCAVLAVTAAMGPAAARERARVVRSDAPTLQCWGIRAGMNSAVAVYAEPSLRSPMLGITHAMVAALGQPMAGFVPVVTSSGVRGFVDQRTVSQGRWTGMNCSVSRDASGHLHFQYGMSRSR